MKKLKYLQNIYRPKTQKYLLVEHLNIVRSITPLEAESLYKIRRLAARISEMNGELPPFGQKKVVRILKNDLTGQRYAKYSINTQAALLEKR